MFSKVLVANRGEIAIRAFRAAFELGARTVAVFPYEDRWSEHRLKADEAYEIGERGHPVRAYLDADAIVAVAVRAGADAIYPGYGFLSENPRLAEACANAGITFIGPTADVLTLTGNKARAIAAAKAAGVPVLAGVQPSTDVESLVAASASMPYPLFVKAVAGGGGRGMRKVDEESALREAIETCMREAEAAFGDAEVFIEQAVVDPRHIEVQILADGAGEVIHLFERDCSVQRRHQKVVEIAPAPNLDPATRERMCADAVRFAREIGYRNAGTVEFLLDPRGHYVFIEMNPRIQVEHTVTEEVTDVDLVQSQMRIASGETLADLGLSQDTVSLRGAALQCRITTEDPANGFRPDTGKITTYRSPGGAGVRLDGGTTYTGAEISAHFDSMLAKLTCRGSSFDKAVQRRHQKVVEIAPAPNLPAELRDRMCADAVRFAQQIGYRNAGTVEFLLDPDGTYVFIEMNPRIQVEHTVTEEVTGVDLVQSQIRIAGGATFAELGLSQSTITVRGVAVQCRVTTEDPRKNFQPDTGRIEVFRAGEGMGIRLDGGSGYTGAQIAPDYDS
ncbi:MAG: biotin carboxylase N-terminal domain-containing protein, partial [Nocardioides sp.]